VGAVRQALIRSIRYFVLKPLALIGWLVGIVVVIALIVVVPMFIPSIPGVGSLRGNSAPAATEDYLKGNQQYDAGLVWNSLDEAAQARLRDQGGSQDDLQKQMEASKAQGIQVAEVSYIGGKAQPDGTSVQFYLIGLREQTRSDLDYQSYMFTLDRDGKIAKVQ
jgi:hypothetical protein